MSPMVRSLQPLHRLYSESRPEIWIPPQHCRQGGRGVDNNTICSQFENYVNSVICGQKRKYHIQNPCWNEGDLVVFPALTPNGQLFEVQIFAKNHLSKQLYHSRQRRIRRLRQSEENFIEEIDQEGAKIIISRTSRQDLKRKYESRKVSSVEFEQDPMVETPYGVVEEDFPSLGSSSPTSSRSSPDREHMAISDFDKNCPRPSGKPSSFAEAVSTCGQRELDTHRRVQVWKYKRPFSGLSTEVVL